MELAKYLEEKQLLYIFAFIFIFYIILGNSMILRAHLYLALILAGGVSYYLVKKAREKKFFD